MRHRPRKRLGTMQLRGGDASAGYAGKAQSAARIRPIGAVIMQETEECRRVCCAYSF